jgi:hypothetical protein
MPPKRFNHPKPIKTPTKKPYDRKPLLVAVGSPDDVRSSIWRLWIQNEDAVYFGTQDTLPAFKISLHKSGIWRAAFVKSLDKTTNTDRAVKKWKRPNANHDGMTSAVAVVISPIPPREPCEPHRVSDLRIKWIPPAPRHKIIVLFIVIADAQIGTDPIRFGHDRLLGRLKKANGETVCLVANERPLTADIVDHIQEVMTKLQITVDQEAIDNRSLKRARALMFNAPDVIGPRNSPTIFDVEIGLENLVPKTATSPTIETE